MDGWDIFALMVFMGLGIFILWGIYKFLVNLFNIVSSLCVVAAVVAVVYPPYKLYIPGVVEINLGRYPIWDVPKSQNIGAYLPLEIKKLVPSSIEGLKIHLVADNTMILTNLLCVSIIYLIVLSIYLVHRNET